MRRRSLKKRSQKSLQTFEIEVPHPGAGWAAISKRSFEIAIKVIFPRMELATVMVTDVLEEGDKRKKSSVEALRRELGSIRTGRANPTLVESILVDYYGVPTPLNQLATITVPEARLLVVQPWDKQSLPLVEKAILKYGLGLNPVSDGTVLRLAIPQLTEERRKELVRVVRKKVEDGRVEVRNIRRDVLEQLRAMEKNKEISQDEGKRAQEQLQRLTDYHIAQIDALAEEKEKEVMEV